MVTFALVFEVYLSQFCEKFLMTTMTALTQA